MKDTKRTASRQALAEAIDGLRQAEAGMGHAKSAHDKARDNLYSARNALDEYRKAAEEHRGEFGAAFVAAVAAGEDCDAATLEKADPDLEKKLQAEIDIWERTRTSCQAIIGEAEAAAGYARRQVEKAAQAVAAEEAAIAAETILDGLQELHEELRRRRAILMLLARHLPDDSPLRRTISSYIAQGIDAPFGASSGERHWPDNHPACAEWERAFQALETSADARLPDVKGVQNV